MGRRKYIIIGAVIATLSILGSDFTFAQGGPHKQGKRRGGFGHRQQNGSRGPHERVLQLSPEERQAFRKNAERWLQMGPEERNLLRQREKIRRERLKGEAEAAMRQLDLRLDQKARDEFEARYLQERRRIERELRQEFEARRQRELPQLNERLKNEFQPNQRPPGTGVSPTGSVKKNGK